MCNIAIVGATGLVGGAFLKIIDEYGIKVDQLRLFASNKSLGKVISFQDRVYNVEVIKEGSFKGIDYALFSAGGATSLKYAKQAVKEGATVIDNSSAFRMDPDVPLVVPEINIADAINHKLIANPNCSTIQAVLPLKGLNKKYRIKSISYTTYQAVSGSGMKGIDDLEATKNGCLPDFYPYNISKTCIPQIDDFTEDGYTKEEHKMMNETRKILHNDNILINATCVRVPIENSHAVSIDVDFKIQPNIEDVYSILINQEGVIVRDDLESCLYPVAVEANGTDFVYVGRIRKSKINKNGILLYTVADNLRKGAASNAVQIMKKLIELDGDNNA
jgi:aspartate-semialdehyde dehydrogenase